MDILVLIKDKLTDSVIEKVSNFLGEHPENIGSALNSSVLIVLGGIIRNALIDEETEKVMNVLRDGGHTGEILDDLPNLLENFDKTQIEEKTEWVYIFTINGRIIKIGGTRDGIKNRFGSYLCGHHIPERKKSGKASETNKYIYNTLYFYLENGCNIKLYGYKLPQEHITRSMFGKDVKIRVQTYHSYESILMDEYKAQCGFIPFLCDNSDPEYKE